MENEDKGEKEKKINEDALTFLSKRSESEVPRYTARLKTYVDFQAKRARANAAKSKSQLNTRHQPSAKALAAATRKEKLGDGNKEVSEHSKSEDGSPQASGRRRPGGDNRSVGSRPRTRREMSDLCCRKKRRRRRSCSRRRRRRRCSRRRRRRRRSRCGRRRRRRSCGRRRRRRRSCRRRRRRRC